MFLHPTGLFALLALPAIVALHLFRRRFRPQTVSALFLWVDDDETILAGRKRERLRTSASFWLELLAALLFALALAGPVGCGDGAAKHLVCVLDASASMGAMEDADGRTTRDAAVELARERIAALPARSKVTLIASGTRPRVLAGPAAFAGEARGALDDYTPGAARHDLLPAVALGMQLSGGGAVLLITDRFEPGGFPPEVELVSIGAARSNVAITHAARVRTEENDTDRVMVSVTAFAPDALTTTLSIASEGVVIEEREVELTPDERRHFVFEVPATVGPIELFLPPDALAIDDRAYLAPVPPRTISLATTLAPAAARELGIATGDTASGVDGLLALVPHSVEAPDARAADLVLSGEELDGTRAWNLVLERGAGEPLDLIGPFLAERSHPLLDGLTLEGIVWSVDAELALPGTPIVSAGDQAILAEEISFDDRRTLHLNLNPFRSTLQRSPDWPIFLANLAEARRAELPGAVHTNIAIGEAFAFRGDVPATYTIRPLPTSVAAPDPTTEARAVRARDVLVVEDLDVPGLYAVERDGREVCQFGVSFKDAQESDLRSRTPGERPPENALANTASALGPLETGLLVGALLALLADWWVLVRMRRAGVRIQHSGGGDV